MFEIHWDIMKYLVESGHAKNVTVRYNTNLSRTSFKGTNLYDLLPHFKKVNVSASIDGTDKIVEYIRHGIKWETWLDNFKKGLFLNELYGDDGMVLDITITSPGLFSMKDLFDLALELNVKSYIKKTFAFDSSIIISPSMIPRTILNQIIDDNINYMKLKVTPKTKIYIESLENLKITNTFEEIYDNYLEGIVEGKKRMILIDKLRNNEGVLENIFSKNTDLINWWLNI
jgi:hypothetical protein